MKYKTRIGKSLKMPTVHSVCSGSFAQNMPCKILLNYGLRGFFRNRWFVMPRSLAFICFVFDTNMKLCLKSFCLLIHKLAKTNHSIQWSIPTKYRKKKVIKSVFIIIALHKNNINFFFLFFRTYNSDWQYCIHHYFLIENID